MQDFIQDLPPIRNYYSIEQYMDNFDILEKILSADSSQMKVYQTLNQQYEHMCTHRTADILRLLNHDYDKLFVVAMDPLLNWTLPGRFIKNNARLSVIHFQINKYRIVDRYRRKKRISHSNYNIVDVLDDCRYLKLHFESSDVHFFNTTEPNYITNLLCHSVFEQLSNYNRWHLYSDNSVHSFPRLLLFDNLYQSLRYKEKMLTILSNVTVHNVEVLKQL